MILKKELRIIYLILICFIILLSGCDTVEQLEEVVEDINIQKWNDYVMESTHLAAKDGEKIPFILLKPKTKIPAPCVLVIHGLAGSKEEMIAEEGYVNGDILIEKLLKNGIAVSLLDCRMHGEYAKEYPDFESFMNDILLNWEYVYYNTLDDIYICLEYLKLRPDINNKLGLFGYSMGGMFTFTISADFEDKLSCSIAAVTPIETETPYPGVPQWTASNIENLPFLMLAGSQDTWYTIEETEWIYNMIPSETKDLIIYDSGHALPDDFIDDSYNWLETYLLDKKS